MTRKQVYHHIANFMGDWKKAKEYEAIFDRNCLLPTKQITSLQLAWGKYSDSHGNYYGENRNTLHIAYTGKASDKYHFSIIR